MANYNFNADLEKSKMTEDEIAKFLESVGIRVLNTNSDNKYDVKIQYKNKIYKVEIKEDFKTSTTGNVAVEFSCRNKPSGIETTKAEFYIYKIHESVFSSKISYYLMKTSKLKKIIKEKKYCRIVNGGDLNSNSMNYLFYLKDIKKISLKLR